MGRESAGNQHHANHLPLHQQSLHNYHYHLLHLHLRHHLHSHLHPQPRPLFLSLTCPTGTRQTPALSPPPSLFPTVLPSLPSLSHRSPPSPYLVRPHSLQLSFAIRFSGSGINACLFFPIAQPRHSQTCRLSLVSLPPRFLLADFPPLTDRRLRPFCSARRG